MKVKEKNNPSPQAKQPVIQSLDRGLHILVILGEAGEPLALNDIAAHFDMDRSSVFRLVATLVKNDFVRQDPDSKKYSLGYRVLELAGRFESANDFSGVIRPIMTRICRGTGQNTHVGVLDGDEVVFIAVEQPRGGISMNIAVGTREPAIPTALGKAIIAFMRPEARDSFLEKASYTRYTNHSIATPGEYRGHIEEVRKNRIALDREEFKEGIVCMAAPILDSRNEARYSIGISGPKDLILPHFDEYLAIVHGAGIEASSLLGGSSR